VKKIKLDDGPTETKRHHFRLKSHRKLFQGRKSKKLALMSGDREFRTRGTASEKDVRC
jgi:hypothetical protein